MSSPQKPPLVDEPVSQGEKSANKKQSGHALHKAGTQTQAEHDVAKDTSAVAVHYQPSPMAHSLPKKGD